MMVWDYGYLKMRCVRLHNCRLSGLRAVFVIVIPSVDDDSFGKIDNMLAEPLIEKGGKGFEVGLKRSFLSPVLS